MFSVIKEGAALYPTPKDKKKNYRDLKAIEISVGRCEKFGGREFKDRLNLFHFVRLIIQLGTMCVFPNVLAHYGIET